MLEKVTVESQSKPKSTTIFPSSLSTPFFRRSGFLRSFCLDFSFSLTSLEINPDIGLTYSKETKRPKWRCALQSTLNCLLPDPRKTAVEGLSLGFDTKNGSIALQEPCLVMLCLDKLKTVLYDRKTDAVTYKSS